jgi:hypothetical protein
MSINAVCTACGKVFEQELAVPTMLCPQCRAAAVSERPMPPAPADSTGLRAGLPHDTGSPTDDEADIAKPPARFWPSGAVTLTLIAALIAGCIIVVLVCF